jgi:hypothetical protein
MKFPVFEGVVKKINERREKENMKHCFTWIGLICLVMFSINADATTPFADDLPDVKLAPLGSGSFPTTIDPAFDLDDYVIDNDETDDVLNWSVSVEAGGPTVNIDSALHDVEILGMGSAGLYDATFTVTDKDTVSRQAASTVKYSEFFVTEPKFTADNRLSFQGASGPRYTYVKLFDGSDSSESTPSLLPYLVSDLGTGAAYTVPTYLSFGPLVAHDLSSGAPVEVARGNTIDVLGALGATVLTPSGSVYLTPTGVLSCAVLISVPAVLDTFDRSGNWDGSVIMVAPAKKIDTYPAVESIFGSNPNHTVNTRFEDIPAGAALQPGGAGTNANRAFITAGWRLDQVGTLPLGTVSILTPAQLASEDAGNAANQFPGATSGNVLQLEQNNASGTDVMFTNLNSFNITPALPGEVYGLSMNIATDIPAAQAASYQQNVQIQFQIQTKPDNGIIQVGALSFAQGAGVDDMVLPTDGTWRQIYTEFIVPTLNQQVDGLYNMMENGFFVNIRVVVKPSTPAFKVFADNIYVYNKGMSDLNYTDVNDESGGLVEEGLANGITAFQKTYDRINNGSLIDMALESGSTLDDNGWRIVGTGRPGVVRDTDFTGNGTAAISSVRTRLLSAGAIAAQIPGGVISSTQNDGIRFGTRQISINGLDNTDTQIVGAPNKSGEGIYGVSFWVASDAADITENPELRVALQEVRPTLNQSIYTVIVGPSALPVGSGDWTQYSLIGAFPSLSSPSAMTAALLVCDVITLGNRLNLVTPAPYDVNKPGSDGTATIYVDDFVFHKVDDMGGQYWNYSLFD